MPVSEWFDGAEASPAPVGVGGHVSGLTRDTVQAHTQAVELLRELHEASNGLGDAFVAAGFAPGEWRTTEALLSELSDQFPDATVDALLTRLSEFAAGTGPGWLRNDGAALDDFEHETRVLGDVIRPLRALAQRQRMTPVRDRGWHSLERVLGDVRVGTQLDRLARTLRALMDLAPHLAPLTPAELAAVESASATRVAPSPAWGQSDEVLGPRTDPWTGQEMRTPMGAGARLASEEMALATPQGILIEDGGDDPDGPTYLLNGELPDAYPDAPTVPFATSSPRMMRAVLGQRPRAWGVLLALGAALLMGTAVLTLALNAKMGAQMPASRSRQVSAAATAAAGALARGATATSAARVRPTATHVPTAPTQPAPARLSVSPSSIVLPCSGNAVSLTVSNTGGQPLTWQASAPANVALSATDGTLAAGTSTIIQARATAPQHGSSSILFTTTSGSLSVAYKTACH